MKFGVTITLKKDVLDPQGKVVGQTLKNIGIQARKDLESFFGKQIHIALFVKVNKNWRNNQNQLKRFGYK